MATIRHCTNGHWGFGTISGSGIKGYMLTPCVYRPGTLFRDGRTRFQKGDLYGTVVTDSDAADRIGLERGYIRPYGRNLTRFVMSRAARRRGMTTTDQLYAARSGNQAARRIYGA